MVEPVDTEQQDVPEQAQNDTTDSSKAQVCNVSTFRTVVVGLRKRNTS